MFTPAKVTGYSSEVNARSVLGIRFTQRHMNSNHLQTIQQSRVCAKLSVRPFRQIYAGVEKQHHTFQTQASDGGKLPSSGWGLLPIRKETRVHTGLKAVRAPVSKAGCPAWRIEKSCLCGNCKVTTRRCNPKYSHLRTHSRREPYNVTT